MTGARTTVAVVQARMGSTRLPGKVLADLGGRPVLQLMLERLTRAHVDRLVVATSNRPGDDPVADLAEALGVPVVRGSEADVLGRFLLALDRFPADDVVRLTADCPLIDPLVVDAAIGLHRRTGADYTSNTLERTFPDGLDVEVVRTEALRVAAAEAERADEREHVTPFVYHRPERFVLASLETGEQLGHERWTLDTADDLDRLRAVVAGLDDPVAAGWHDVLAVAGVQDG
ncbi:MAG TPA: glycosyltransferase family protein, partial [Acidimicrobiales bacterium]|nr:glycosyltransferase family protein [Acidimicrobiales bacterium]